MPLNIAIYVVLVSASVASAVYFNNRLGYTPLLFLLCLTLLDWIYVRLAARRVSVGAPSGEAGEAQGLRVEHGQRARCSVSLRNEGRLPLPRVRVALRVTGPHMEKPLTLSRSVAVPPRSEARLPFDLGLMHVGLFDVRIKSVKICDLLGLFRVSRCRRGGRELACMPRLRPIEGAAAQESPMPAPSGRTPRRSAQGEYDGVRSYEPGDALHNIHWKLSAKSLSYMTRLYEDDEAGTLVIVDLKLPDLPAPQRLRLNDTLLETAVSALGSRVAGGGRAVLLASGAGGPARQEVASPADVLEAADLLLRAGPGDAGIEELLPSGAASVMVCTANADVELVCRLLDIKNAGGRPMLLYVVPEDFKRERENSLFDFLERLDMEYLVAVAEGPSAARR